MPAMSRLGDANQVGGVILRGASTVVCNGKPVGLHPSKISPHPKKGLHKAATTVTASPTVICEGSPVLKVGSQQNCGHSVVEGSPNVIVP